MFYDPGLEAYVYMPYGGNEVEGGLVQYQSDFHGRTGAQHLIRWEMMPG